MSQDLGCGGRMVRWFRLSSSGSGNYLVRVRAQVMMRDDSTGGWLPLGGGGLSNVSVRKRVTQPDLDDPTKHEYLIYGKRISDQHVVLSCTIKKDFEYNKVMPTFHHWKTGDKKFGLTFQTAADARAFDKGVRMAVEDLLDGLNDFPSYRHGLNIDVGDDNVFMTVNLPVEIDTRSSSGSVNTCSSSRHTPTATPLPTPDHPPHHHVHHPHHVHHFPLPGGGMGGLGSAGGTGISTTNTSPSSTTSNLATSTAGSTTQPYPHPHPHANHHHQQHLCRITFPPRPKPPLPHNNNPPDKPLDLDCELKPGNPPDMPQDQDKIGIPGDNYSYVQFDPDYSYPVVEGIKGEKRDSIASLKKQQQFEHVRGTHPQQMPAPLVPSKRQKKKDKRVRKTIKARCRHCQEMFTYDMNSRGSCEYAPDCVRTAIDSLTCISCAQCMLYHCMSDAEGDFAHHPCECGGPGGTADESCGRRWLGVTLLSLLVPCLWCYLPLRACHRCAVACGLCGGRHEAS
ncbi:sprouty-related, EVH1 domain-containing protein 2-like isoform X2 [Homarus americanus]|uniref:Sprouty-related, EVH1 domain-containing protein 2-like n=1 Tax=Homarus americanus TaxID=6706 RepID=A0A8J5MKG0_HOMAM|nr:sprouty-related, EVH1 domain-containing protein 2-like isoform X2 [Homarus americanus]KAG7154714.1 Sprouty-related, EVH1 domain-containing protein 2-like [Homarus americanus]